MADILKKLHKDDAYGVGDSIMFGMCFIFFVVIVVATIEYFIPLSVYTDMRDMCRNTLMRSEQRGGLSSADSNALTALLQNRGLKNITVTGTASAKQGQDVNLRVEADFLYKKLLFLSRTTVTQHFVYDKTLCERKVTN